MEFSCEGIICIITLFIYRWCGRLDCCLNFFLDIGIIISITLSVSASISITYIISIVVLYTVLSTVSIESIYFITCSIFLSDTDGTDDK